MAKVTPQELELLSGATSNIQTQINSITTGSGGATVVTSSLAATFSTGSAFYQDTGLSATFTVTNTNDPILVTFSGWFSVASPGNLVIAVAFDGGTEDLIYSISTTGRCNGAFSKIYANLAAGSHTCKIRMRNQGSAATHDLQFHAIENETPQLNVIRFR